MVDLWPAFLLCDLLVFIPDQLVLLEAGGEALGGQEQIDADSEGSGHRNHRNLRN